MSGDLYSRIPLVSHAPGLSSRRNSWKASTKCTAIISARVPSAFRTHSNSPPTKRQAKAKKFEHHKPGAIAQESCYSTEDLSLIELPNVQCNKPHGASSTKQQPALHEIRLSYPKPRETSPKFSAYDPCICIFAATALFVPLDLIALRPGSHQTFSLTTFMA